MLSTLVTTAVVHATPLVLAIKISLPFSYAVPNANAVIIIAAMRNYADLGPRSSELGACAVRSEPGLGVLSAWGLGRGAWPSASCSSAFKLAVTGWVSECKAFGMNWVRFPSVLHGKPLILRCRRVIPELARQLKGDAALAKIMQHPRTLMCLDSVTVEVIRLGHGRSGQRFLYGFPDPPSKSRSPPLLCPPSSA